MRVLIIKLGATGDVVRTTPLLRRLSADVTWITALNNVVMVHGVAEHLRCLSWEERSSARDGVYDLVINLEDSVEAAAFIEEVTFRQLFGAYLNDRGGLISYTDDSRGWFDMSLISVYGRQRADELKLSNRRTYQQLIFEGLGFDFGGEQYLLPESVETDLYGDVAIAPIAGSVWPMKNWSHYEELRWSLESCGLQVNVLPQRASLLEHIGDVKNHRCLVSGDSLPMHIALGAGRSCVSIFNCTSPWEIYDYGLQTKVISPLLSEHFYRRGADPKATSAVTVDDVHGAVLDILSRRAAVRESRGLRQQIPGVE
jgi:lipopolysaccharide heptosyltransferase II